MEFSFDTPLWMGELAGLADNSRISAAHFLTLLEPEDPPGVEEALAFLDEKRLMLDISDLPHVELTGSNALRLKQESQVTSVDSVTRGLDENDPLRLYLQELSYTPVSSDPQTLAHRYSNGEYHLAEQLVNSCLSMVVEIAMEHTGHGVLLLDLIQEGSMGLWHSITTYPGGDFLEYARWWIRHNMAKAVTLNARSNGIGFKLRQGMRDYMDADQYLLGELGRNPTLAEIADHLHITCEEAAVLEKMVLQANKQDSAQEPEQIRDSEEDQSVDNTAYFQIRQRIAELLSILPERDAKLLTLRFGLENGKPLSPVQVGEILGMTPQQVVQAEEDALSRLRNQ